MDPKYSKCPKTVINSRLQTIDKGYPDEIPVTYVYFKRFLSFLMKFSD